MSKRKAPSASEENYNQDICDKLLELATYEENVTKNRFKAVAYRHAASSLSNLDRRIGSGKEARTLKGVGEKIAKKIDEILETGDLEKLDVIHHDARGQAIILLSKVTGIGPKKATELVDKGITSIEDLEKHKEELNHHQQLGLKYFIDFEKKIPRAEIVEVEKIVKQEIADMDPDFHVTICGSYRREQAFSGDIDILITHPGFTSKCDKHEGHEKLDQVIKKLKDCQLITDVISQGDVKFMGVCNLHKVKSAVAKKANAKLSVSDDSFRRIDIRIFPMDQYFCSILYFTGSDLFNQDMRGHAKDNKFSLSEYCLRPIGSTGKLGEPLEIKSEKDIFEYIDYPYKEPNHRNM